jgi:hypothetical protein
MDAYLLIGNPHTRKASVVRSLSGCFNRSVRDIQPLAARAPLKLYARAGALQDARTSPAAFVDEVAATRCVAVLCCLTPAAHAQRGAELPDAAGYVAHFRTVGWRIAAVAVLGQDGGGVRVPNLRQFAQATTTPINVTAAAVRAHFGWR